MVWLVTNTHLETVGVKTANDNSIFVGTRSFPVFVAYLNTRCKLGPLIEWRITPCPICRGRTEPDIRCNIASQKQASYYASEKKIGKCPRCLLDWHSDIPL